MAARVEPDKLKPGELIDGWRVVRRIDNGSYGVVYEVEKGGRRAALKIAFHRAQSGDSLRTDARMLRELICLYQLEHPSIVRIWASGRWPDPDEGYRYIILEFIDGYTLGEWKERTYPTPHEVVVLFEKLFAALEHMQEHGVFHRDFSLANILVHKSEGVGKAEVQPVIIDFSVGDYPAARELTEAPLPPGTRRYRSPEALRFFLDHRHDPEARYPYKVTDELYALGGLLYDVLTDPRPTEKRERLKLDNPKMQPPSPCKVNGRVPAALSDFCQALLARDPAHRPASPKDGRRVLADLKQHQGEEWHVPVHPPAVPRMENVPSVGRAWRKPVFGGMLALLVLLGLVAALPRSEAPRPVAAEEPVRALYENLAGSSEKETARPGGLDSPRPTQQTESIAVKLPENLAPPSTPETSSQPALRESSASAPSWRKCALAVASVAWLKMGCAGVELRPKPEDCPEKTIKAMRKQLGLKVDVAGDEGVLWLVLDEKRLPAEGQSSARGYPTVALVEGPVTGVLAQGFPHSQRLPPGTRFEGHLWTRGDQLYGRYFKALLPDGSSVPVCLELGDFLGQPGQHKEATAQPGTVMSQYVGPVFGVSEFH